MALAGTSTRGRGLYRRAIFAFLLMGIIPVLVLVYETTGLGGPAEGPAADSSVRTARLVALVTTGVLAVLGFAVLLSLIRSICHLVGDLHAAARGLTDQVRGDYADADVREAAESLQAMTRRLVETSHQLRQRGKQLDRSYNDLMRLQAELQHAHRVRNAFITRASQEMRAPLAKIRNHAGTLAEGYSVSNESRDCLDAIAEGAGSLSAMIERLLEIANVQTGVTPVRLGEEDLVPLCRSAADRVAGSALERGVVVRVEQDIDSMPALADAAQMGSALELLLTHAAAPERGVSEVVLSFRRDGPQLLVSVADNGEPAQAQLLREVLDGAWAEAGADPLPHLGLDLMMARAVVDKHGGEIYADSRSGGVGGQARGTTLTVALPAELTDARLMAALRQTVVHAKSSGEPATLVLVDTDAGEADLPRLRGVVQSTVRGADHVGVTASGRIAFVCRVNPGSLPGLRARVRSALQADLASQGRPQPRVVTASASYPADGADVFALVAAARLRLPDSATEGDAEAQETELLQGTA